jgi:hypothetical protein
LRDIQRRCAGCYQKIRQQKPSDVSLATAKKIKTFCSDCEKFFLSGLYYRETFRYAINDSKKKIAKTKQNKHNV